jgi:hypothetical protein
LGDGFEIRTNVSRMQPKSLTVVAQKLRRGVIVENTYGPQKLR